MPRVSLNNVLLIYKKSKYQIYFEERQLSTTGLEAMSREEIDRLIEAHEQHLAALETVLQVLKARNIRFRTIYRARHVDYTPYDFVISVGGDGTLIEAARCINGQPLLGVNSDPKRSFGHFCTATADTFPAILDGLIAGKGKLMNLNRLALTIDGRPLGMTIMNELLVAHHRAAAMSRYTLSINGVEENQLSSGVWVSTAAGSTGSIYSAGGKLMAPRSRRIQYLPREVFNGDDADRMKLRGGIIPADSTLWIRSRMRDGEISLDGCRCRVPLGFGQKLEIRNAETPIRLVVSGSDRISKSKKA